MLTKSFLTCCLLLSFIGLTGQESSCDYYPTIRYVENDSEIRTLVASTFPHRVKNKKQKFPISFSVADSLTFININFVLEGNFNAEFGLDSTAFNSAPAYTNLYYHKNIPLLPKIPNPPKDSNPLNLFVSKRIGNTITVEIIEDAEYPSTKFIRFGVSVIAVLLVDESNGVIKKLYAGVVYHN